MSEITTDHDTIRHWAKERNATPVAILSKNGTDTGLIQLDFPGFSGGESLKPIDWDEWFRRFDEHHLALVYQNHTTSGDSSNFNHFVSR